MNNDKRSVTQVFFIDVLNLFKEDGLYCEIQSDDDKLINSIKLFDQAIVTGDYSAYFPLNEENKKMLVDNVIEFHSEEYIHHFEIQKEKKNLFVAYDGFEIAQITSEIQLSEYFIKKYVKTKIPNSTKPIVCSPIE